MAKILGGIEHQRKDVSVQLFKDYMTGAFAFNKASGNNEWKVIQETLEKTLNRYRGDKGTLGITDGTQKGVFGGHAEAVVAIKEMLAYIKEIADQSEKQNEVSAESARQLKQLAKIDIKAANEFADELLGKTTTKRSSSTVESNSQIAKDIKNELSELANADEKTFAEIRKGVNTTEKQIINDKVENVREAVADSNEQQTGKLNADINRDVARATKKDMNTGFNTDAKANELIGLVRSILSAITGKQPEEATVPPTKTSDETEQATKQDAANTKTESPARSDYSFEMKAVYDEIAEVLSPIEKSLSLVPMLNSSTQSKENPFAVTKEEFNKALPKLLENETGPQVKKSKIYASQFNQGIFKGLETAFERLIGVSKQYEKVLGANAEAQDEMAAERIETYGLNNGRNPNDTGDKAGMRRILELYRTNKSSIDQNPELIQNIQLTPGRDVDTTELLKELNKALSGDQMAKAQNGGGFWKNALGFATGGLGYAFMPSLEKSRAQADGLNQMLGNISNSLQSVLVNIQTKETELAGLEKKGDIKFDDKGNVLHGTSAAKKTLADLEEEKLVLDSIKADLLANDEIIKKTGGRFSQLVKYLNFTSPVLKDNNGILRNINSGLDKNGKALKFQTRLAEILNYTYQLMTRHIGQMFKNWMMQLNPITQIKKAFSDFMGYNTKWQRTMNVVKYNLRDVIAPIMEKIAQLLVNMIGFADIILQKVQAAFGNTPISLFDQENAKKFKDEVEQINNITAGIDELHDIGQDSDKDPNNLLGDIYKPQLSQEWIDLAERIGDLFAGVIKGDLGFGDVMKEILGIAWQGVKTLWNEILWPFIRDTIWPAIKDNWLEILGWILAAFLAWKGLKLLGDLLFNALFGKLTLGNITGVFSKIGGWISGLLGATGFGQGIMLAFQSLLAGGKYSLIGTLGEMFTNSAAITQAGSWGSMIGFALVKGLVGVLSIALGGKMLTDAFDSAADKTSYNIGLEQSGGNKEDKKGTGWDIAKGAAGGAAIGFGIGQIIPVVGPLVGAAIGAVVGALTTSLAPAFEAVEVAARNANNEMQKIEYYEGQVQGFSTQVNNLTEFQKILNDTLQLQTEKVYEEGEQLGITKQRMDELVAATANGTFTTDMLSGSELGLKDSLIQLDAQQTKNKEATEKLEAAKRKLQKAEIDLAIAEDVAAGNFEMAAARVEYALAAELYETDEATKKMTQIIKEGSAEQAADILQDLSPEMRKNFDGYYSETESHLNELTDLYYKYNKDEREYFLENLTPEVQKQMQERVDAIRREVENAPWYMRLLDVGNDGKILGMSYVDVPGYATGTNYVPSDGLAYLHKGEAVIPAKYNEGMGTQGKAYQQNTAASQELLVAIARLEDTLNKGINVHGQFVQRGSDLVATVEKANNRMSNNILNNRVYAR